LEKFIGYKDCFRDIVYQNLAGANGELYEVMFSYWDLEMKLLVREFIEVKLRI